MCCPGGWHSSFSYLVVKHIIAMLIETVVLFLCMLVGLLPNFWLFDKNCCRLVILAIHGFSRALTKNEMFFNQDDLKKCLSKEVGKQNSNLNLIGWHIS